MGEWPGPSKKTAQYDSVTATTIAAGSNDFLDWDYQAGAVLFDVTDPQNPIVLESGDYAFTVTVYTPDTMTGGKTYEVNLILDVYGTIAGFSYQDSVPASADLLQPFQPRVSVSLTYFIPAGGYINLGINNTDIVDISFGINNAAIRKLS